MPKLQIFISGASCRQQHLTPPLAGWNPVLPGNGWMEREGLNCLLLQDTLKGNKCTNSTEKKEPSIRWLRVGIENSNNFSLKKSTLDTLLVRTYKQTELLCTHINKRHSLCCDCHLAGSQAHTCLCTGPAGFRTHRLCLPRTSSVRTFVAGLSGAEEGRGETPVQMGAGVPLALRASHPQVCAPFVFHRLTVPRDGVTGRCLSCPDIPHPT